MTRRLATAPELLDSLEASGWGDIAAAEYRCARAILAHVARKGERIVTTVAQLADRIGYSSRHTARGLQALEALHLVRWTRGHIEHGKPRPGWVQVSRSRLRQFVAHAAALAKWTTKERRKETAERIRTTVRNDTLWTPKRRPSTHNPLSSHVDMASTLPPYRGHRPGPAAQQPGQTAREDTTMNNKQPCIHAMPDINGCGICRRELRLNPGMDVQTLWAPAEDRPTRETQRAGFALVRAALRQKDHAQDSLT